MGYASLGNGIVDRPSSVTVYKSDGVTVAASATYSYDEYAVSSNTQTAPQHVAVTGSRGNLTTSTSNGLSSHLNYYDTGTVNTATDANGAVTTLNYPDSTSTCGDAFPTSVSLPLSLTTYSTFNCNGAVATQAKDANQQPTNFTYDNMNRVLTRATPDGGSVSIAYNDTASPPNVVATTLLKTGTNRVDTTQVDGLGRTIHQLLTSDPAGTTHVDTTYDSLGRVSAVTNPYRTICSPVTNCEVQYAYDALNRVLTVTNQDATYTSVSYSSNCATATDESSHARKTCSDPLGRVTQVFEDPSGQNLETDYTYDALDDLTQTQAVPSGQTRTYLFDSLRRLTSAATPETAQCAITYTYNSNGDLATRVAPSPNQGACATKVTTTYSFDTLHRLTGKTYSNGNPSATYFYDQTSYNGLTITNGKGRRTGMSDGSGQTAWSYDTMGRALTANETIGTITKAISYTYNFDGSPASVTYPSGRVVSYDITGAGLPTYAKDTANGINYAQSAAYAPQGAISSVLEGYSGSFAGITLSAGYNNRLQPTSVTATSSNGTAINFAYSYFANGNVQTQTNNRDTGRTQSFTYDALNRISTAQSAATSGADCWGQSIPTDSTGYDRYGNLKTINSTKCSTQALSISVDSTTNRITSSGFIYDAAGEATLEIPGNYQPDWLVADDYQRHGDHLL